MAWIELHQTLPTNKKTLRLKSILKISQAEAIGHLCMLWLWAVDNAPDGNLSEFYSEEIASISGWDKEPDEYMQALINSGFVDGNKVIHEWYSYAGKLIDKRKEDADRKRIAREKLEEIRRTSAGHPQDSAETSENNPAVGAGNTTLHNTTPPYPTVPNLYDVVVKGEKSFKVGKEERTKVCMESVWGKEPSQFEVGRAIKLIEGLNEEVTPEAIKLFEIALKVCEERQACNIAFLTGIYNNFRDRGIKTVADYYDYEQGVKHG